MEVPMVKTAEEKPQLVKARIMQGRLKYLLSRAAGAVGRMHPYYLIHIYLTRVQVTATNLDITIIVEMDKDQDETIDMGGVICVPAQKFQAIIDALPDALIEISALSDNKIQIECGDYNGMLPSVDPVEHFPAVNLPTGPSIVIGGDVITDIYSACRHAIAKDISKGMLSGFHITTNDDQLLGVGCDGHRLSLAAKAVEESISLEMFDKGITLPSKMCIELAKIKAGYIGVCTTDSSIVVAAPGITVMARLLDGEYPSYRRVIPTTNQHCCVANTSELSKIVERVSILSESDSVVLDILPGTEMESGDIQIKTQNSAGEISDLVPCEVQGEPAQIRFNPIYLLEALSSIGKSSEDAVIKYSAGKAGVVLIPADHGAWDERLEVVMPKG
jgi:DNA polymerase-3 subunit beta